MLIRRLAPSDAAAWQALRLIALRECPSAFSSSYDAERQTPLTEIEAHLAPDSGRNRLGVFDGPELVGMAGVGRDTAPKVRHKAFIAGMYIAKDHRGKGLGRQLLGHALSFAQSLQGVRQLTLAVTTGNAEAVSLSASMGFKVYGQEPRALLVDGVFHDKLLMACHLDAA